MSATPTRPIVLVVSPVRLHTTFIEYRVPVLFSHQSGAGPSGLVLALTLAKNGIPVRIIEKDSKFHEGERGAGTQPRTLEVYNYLGVAEDILEKGLSVKKMNVYKLPEGKEILKSFPLAQVYLPTPSVPFVSRPFTPMICVRS